jgi:hypothetical protein
MKSAVFLIVSLLFAAPTAVADPLTCDVSNYKAMAGLEALARADQLTVTWTGQDEVELRMRYGIQNREPIIRELAIRRPGESWTLLGENPQPFIARCRHVRSLEEPRISRRGALRITTQVASFLLCRMSPARHES